jgi:hypothetical protein
VTRRIGVVVALTMAGLTIAVATGWGAGVTRPQINDILIRGYLVSIQEGSAAKRVAIGFGSGASELKTAVEGFRDSMLRGVRTAPGFGTPAGQRMLPSENCAPRATRLDQIDLEAEHL